ncbi:hypothetical protein SNEBB_002635 [Seison nebaliae]|nr:hypothetical protein SNEBB_002635 [Seison nebaliae]
MINRYFIILLSILLLGFIDAVDDSTTNKNELEEETSSQINVTESSIENVTEKVKTSGIIKGTNAAGNGTELVTNTKTTTNDDVTEKNESTTKQDESSVDEVESTTPVKPREDDPYVVIKKNSSNSSKFSVKILFVSIVMILIVF